jgi:hypothetical protein
MDDFSMRPLGDCERDGRKEFLQVAVAPTSCRPHRGPRHFAGSVAVIPHE